MFSPRIANHQGTQSKNPFFILSKYLIINRCDRPLSETSLT